MLSKIYEKNGVSVHKTTFRRKKTKAKIKKKK